MTSVPFDLNVAVLNERGKNDRYDTVDFRFTTKAARALERAAGSGITWLVARGQSVEALVLLLCYGLQWQFPKMTETRAEQILDAYLERGGDVAALSDACARALKESGLYGKPESGDEARPTTTTETTSEAIPPPQ